MWLFSRLVFLCVCVGNVHVCAGGGNNPFFSGVVLGSGGGGVDNGVEGLGALSSLIAS